MNAKPPEIPENLLILVSGMMNTSGGVIFVPDSSGDPITEGCYDKWIQKFQEKLAKFMTKDTLRLCVRHQMKDTEILLTIHKSCEFVTRTLSMTTRSLAGNEKVITGDSITRTLQNSTAIENYNRLDKNQTYKAGDKCRLNEGPHIEFKLMKKETALDIIKHIRSSTQKDKNDSYKRLLHALLGMGNQAGGGDVILGVEDNSVMVGQEMDEADEVTFKTELAKVLIADPNGVKRVWGSPDVVPTEGQHWECDVYPLQGPYYCSYDVNKRCPKCPHQERRVLINIHINACPNGVYEQLPEAYVVQDDGKIACLTYPDWLEHHRPREVKKKVAGAPLSSSSTQRSKSLPSTSHQLPSQQTRKRKLPYDVFVFKKSVKLSYKSNSSYSTHTFPSPDDFDKHKESVMFEMTNDAVNYTPHKSNIIKELGRDGEQILQEIEKKIGWKNAFVFAVDSFYSCMKHDVTPLSPSHHLCDFVAGNNSGELFTFTTFTDAGSRGEESEQKAYTMELGRLLKKKIVENLEECTDYSGLRMQCFVRRITGDNFDSHSYDGMYSKPSSSLISKLSLAFTKIIQQRETCFKDNLGVEIPTKFTAEQMECILKSNSFHINLIDTVAGTGKTYIAQYLCEIKGRHNSIYFTCATNMKNFVVFNGKADAVCVKNGEELLSMIKGQYEGRQHIIVDEAHHLNGDEQTWQEIITFIIDRQKYLYLFQDTILQDYKTKPEDMTLGKFVKDHEDEYSFYQHPLTVILRQSSIVGSFVKAHAAEACKQKGKPIKYHSKVEGKDVSLIHLEGIRKKDAANGLISHVKSLVSPQSQLSASRALQKINEITILCSSGEERSLMTEIFNEYWPESKPNTAGHFPREGLVIDTLDNFYGLDSIAIVFLIPITYDVDNIYDNPKFRLSVATRGRDLVQFVQDENIKSHQADRLRFDKPKQDDIKRPKAEEDASPPTKYEHTMLHDAARQGDLARIKQLIDKGLDVNALNDNNWSAISVALANGHLHIVRHLLSSGANPDLGTRTALGVASYYGHEDVVKLLLDKDCPIDTVDGDGYTALLMAYEGGQEATIKQLLENRADPTAGRRTPLGQAALGGHVEIVKQLIQEGSPIDAVDDYGWTPLLNAYQGGHEATIKVLSAEGADPTAGRKTPLGAAAAGGHLEIVEHLIKEGHSVDELDADGYSPLSWAYRGGNESMVQFLRQSGAVPGVGKTKPLVDAALGGQTSMVQDLLDKGGDINETDEDGDSPLAAAVYLGRLDTVKLLLEKGADTSLGGVKSFGNKDGLTALGLAQQRNYQNIVKLLKKHGVTE